MLNNFRFMTSGESHGKCLNAIIDGIPAGFEIDTNFINSELIRRQSGFGRGGRMQIESDKVEIKSGIRFGKTTGAPICLEVVNKDFENWQSVMSVEKVDISDENAAREIEEKKFTKPRPGHADFAGAIKYDLKDLRDVLERSSARKTAMEVAIGAIAKQILNEFDITCSSKILQIGNETREEKFPDVIEFAKNQGDTLGGKFELNFINLPVGLGSHVQWDRKLDGLIAQAVMSIPAVKSVEIGAGVNCAELFGSQMHDEIFISDGEYYRKTNNAGGIEGGMTNGETLVVKASMKPIPTMKKPLSTIDFTNKSQTEAHFERSDVCAVSSCAVVAEAIVACVLLDAFLDKFGKDNLSEIKKNYSNRLK